MIYVIGSLKNPEIPRVAAALRDAGHKVFDDWYAAGPEADDYWQAYEKERGNTYPEAIAGYHAEAVFEFDLKHLHRADTVVLVLPAGKSGHLELGWALGRGKNGYILFTEEPERFDVMYRFADGVFTDLKELLSVL